MSAILDSVHLNSSLVPAQRAANSMLLALLGIGVLLILLLIATLAMFAETLLPHLVEFCLMAWEALSVQVAYRLMFLGLVVLVLSLLGFLLRLGWNARATEHQVQLLLAKKVLPPARLANSLEKLGLTEDVDTVAAPIPTAFCYGKRAPRILVTTGLVELLSEQELLSVLAHEKYHRMQHDPFKILLVRALRDALVFLPLARDLFENYLVLQEIAADQVALRTGATRESLASALLKLLHVPTLRDLSVSAYTPLGVRVQHLANPERSFVFHFSWRRTVVSAFAFALMLTAVFHPMAPMALGEALHADCHPIVVLAPLAGSVV